MEKVFHLILFQGVGCGLFGGILYSPIYVLLGEWFDKRKGQHSPLQLNS